MAADVAILLVCVAILAAIFLLPQAVAALYYAVRNRRRPRW